MYRYINIYQYKFDDKKECETELYETIEEAKKAVRDMACDDEWWFEHQKEPFKYNYYFIYDEEEQIVVYSEKARKGLFLEM